MTRSFTTPRRFPGARRSPCEREWITSKEDRARVVTKGFGGVGFRTVNEGDVFTHPADAELPPHFVLNSEEFTGHVPHNAPRFDPAEYAKANQKRPEPAAPVMLTEADIKRQKGLSDAQWKLAVSTGGFPKARAYRED